ncbi:MAG: FtsL-like putative cell division protein [Patescibacteria group bacterium]|nr:FtsL-like putative cell division protein [Patescibacteria group bacterium]
MLITKSNLEESGLRKRTIDREIKIGPLSIQFVVIIILAALALLYLAQSTQSATKNYQIRELEDQKSKIEEENKRLEIETVRLKSLNEIKSSVKDLNLETAKNN